MTRTRQRSPNDRRLRRGTSKKPGLLGRSLVAAAGSGALLLWAAACQSESRSQDLADASPIAATGSVGYALYQANCAACHGTTGNGKGAAAIALETRPRDFWNEPFRYVSTLDGIATVEDLSQTIRAGRLHGEMPSGPWLSDDEVRALAEYVLELNRLGWVQRLSQDASLTPEDVEEIAIDRVTPLEPITVSMPGPLFRPSSAVGRSLYLQSCASCHGQTGRGDGLETPLDEQGRPIKVRDLVVEPIHGGADPVELFKRIRCGVPGTPMPAQSLLSDEQIWQLVYYTRDLMGDPLGSSVR
jgi:mono/diheme cytochrome c family protein